MSDAAGSKSPVDTPVTITVTDSAGQTGVGDRASSAPTGRKSDTEQGAEGKEGDSAFTGAVEEGEHGSTLAELRTVAKRKDSLRRRHRSLDILNFDDEDLRRRSTSMVEAKEQTYSKLKEELLKAQHELKLKDEEVGKLAHVRDQMGEELEELTACLFEEANKMVQDANIKRMNTEKLLKESNDKIAVLQAEVAALKALVLTSTPSKPNSHLHPQIKKEGEITKSASMKGHKRSASHHFLKKEPRVVPTEPEPEEPKRVDDPKFYDEFVRWRLEPELTGEAPFLKRVLLEDIRPCLNMSNAQLAEDVLRSVGDNILTIEPVNAASKKSMRKCALSERTSQCSYRIRLGDTAPWLEICESVRNRVARVCDFYTYIRYIRQGLVKSCDVDMFWHITHLRQQMALARLGLS